MYLPREVERRLYEDLGPPRLWVRLDPVLERWCCFERHRRLGGARKVPFSLSPMGDILPGESAVRTMLDWDDRVVVLETPDGSYRSLDPNLFARELVLRDTWRYRGRDLAARLLRQVREARERRGREESDLFADLAQDNRRRFARIADQMGI